MCVLACSRVRLVCGVVIIRAHPHRTRPSLTCITSIFTSIFCICICFCISSSCASLDGRAFLIRLYNDLFRAQGRKMLEVSTLQAVVLMMFNDAAEVSFRTIAERCRSGPAPTPAAGAAADAELRRMLQSLACVKDVRVLTKTPRGREIGDEDTFVVNAEFKHALFKIKINSIQMKETVRASVLLRLRRILLLLPSYQAVLMTGELDSTY